MGVFIFSGGEPWAFALRVSTALGFTLYAEKIYKKPFQTRIGKTVKIENSVLDLIFRMCYNENNQSFFRYFFKMLWNQRLSSREIAPMVLKSAM